MSWPMRREMFRYFCGGLGAMSIVATMVQIAFIVILLIGYLRVAWSLRCFGWSFSLAWIVSTSVLVIVGATAIDEAERNRTMFIITVAAISILSAIFAARFGSVLVTTVEGKFDDDRRLRWFILRIFATALAGGAALAAGSCIRAAAYELGYIDYEIDAPVEAVMRAQARKRFAALASQSRSCHALVTHLAQQHDDVIRFEHPWNSLFKSEFHVLEPAAPPSVEKFTLFWRRGGKMAMNQQIITFALLGHATCMVRLPGRPRQTSAPEPLDRSLVLRISRERVLELQRQYQAIALKKPSDFAFFWSSAVTEISKVPGYSVTAHGRLAVVLEQIIYWGAILFGLLTFFSGRRAPGRVEP